MAPKLTHIAIHARDIEKAVSFYKSYAELSEVHRRVDDNTTVVWLAERSKEKEFVIVLIGVPHADPVDPQPMAHLGYSVASRTEVDAIAGRARGEGILVLEPTDGGKIVGYFCMLHDPDGNWVEFSYGQSLGPS